MCRGKGDCSVLGTDPSRWNVSCLLPPLDWFEFELNKFCDAVRQLADGDRSHSIETISKIRSDEMREWCVEHGQMSGKHRARKLMVPKPDPVPESERDSLSSPRKYEREVFLRDGFKCRYCGIRLVSNKVFIAFKNHLNSDSFQKGPTNAITHGAIHVFNPVADHVVPWRLGGRTIPENLVSSCGPCNYGKDGYTVEQLGITNPLLRLPVGDDWDGLISY
jgi:5-methylcytosine-specific restriction endonuclease McrA